MFPPSPQALPSPFDKPRAAQLRDEWIALGDEAGPELATFVKMAAADGGLTRVLDGVFGNSPFLSKLLLQNPDVLKALFEAGPDAFLNQIIAGLSAPIGDIPAEMTLLRAARARAALAIALADISQAWTVERVTVALSDFADACVQRAVRALLRQAHERGHISLQNPDDPEYRSGYAVIAVGKHGARELNYSSDIDLLVLYDDGVLPYAGKKSPQEFAVQLTKDLVRVLEERTAQGYVFRTDLRLRPDPGSTAIAVSRSAAQIYYGSYGQNWERAAMIKARAVAGDRATGENFLSELQPFIWRKSLDFYALQDIHSIKRQIYAHKGGSKIQVAGHNIKVGRGGIREIEFFAQTQQLVWGGRFPEARDSQTLPALDMLVKLHVVEPAVRDDLHAAYKYLRNVEHRLQMIEDAQTQTLPAEPHKLAHLATFLGYSSAEAFAAELTSVLRKVEIHYAALFEDAPSLGVEGNLVFTGTEDDPDTIATLKRLGYQNPSVVAQTVRGWHHSRYRAFRSDRARQLLTELMPGLLKALGKTTQPDAAFARFDRCLSQLPSGVQLLSVFYSNTELLDLVAEIMGDAPRLAEHLTRNPSLLDYVLEPEFFAPIAELQGLKEDLDRTLKMATNFEAVLDMSRRWANDLKFRVGVQTLRRMVNPLQAARHLSDVAEAVIGGLIPRVGDEFAVQFGRVPGGELGVLALGKLGSHELTATSDLDLVLIYDAPADAHSTGGAKPLPTAAYYIRLAQRIGTAFTMLTREGNLYELDLRLRPNGDKGPLATSLESFAKYQTEDAWTWEHMALTRARVVLGSPALRAKIEQTIAGVLKRPRDPAALVTAVADMRAKMRKELKAPGLWEIKRGPGGQVDAEFIIQYLLLRHPDAFGFNGAWPDTHPLAAIDRLAEFGYLAPGDAETLKGGLALWAQLQAMLRLTMEGETPGEDTPLGLKARLTATASVPSFETLEDLIRTTAADISAVFGRIIEQPAEDARKTLGPEPPR